MSYLFAGCESLKEIDIGKFDTSLVKTMSHMFDSCISLSSFSLNYINFDTSIVTDFSYMFNGCTNLVSLNISNFNTNSAKDMSRMFSNCNEMRSLDLTSFVTTNCFRFNEMFANTTDLTVRVNSNSCSNMIKEIEKDVNVEIVNE